MSAPAGSVAAAAATRRATPYQGLVPFSDADAEWFFGRAGWRDTIVDNLVAYRVSVLHGASGVGKTSVLRAGVERTLRDQGRTNVAAFGAPELLCVVFQSWSLDDPSAALKEAIGKAAADLSPELAADPPEGSLAEVVTEWSSRIEGPVFLVLDQFEEYFLYEGVRSEQTDLAEELVEALRRRDTPLNVLLALRQEALSELDRLKGRVPGLLDNLLRIGHLDRDAAREAIVRPLVHWNDVAAEGEAEVGIEDELVEAVLDECTAGRLSFGDVGEGVVDGARTAGTEAPYLQLVLTRLWDEERSAGSPTLRIETLHRLGGADRIVRTHLDSALAALPRAEQDVAGRTLRYLVTPSGTKIAHRVRDLAEYTHLPEQRLEPVVGKLAREARILRPAGDGRFEIYHDALAGPILDWRTRWDEEQKRRRERRRAAIVAGLVVVLAAIAAAIGFLWVEARRSERAAQDAEREARSALTQAAEALAANSLAAVGTDPLEALKLAVEAGEASPARAESALRAALAAPQPEAVLWGQEREALTGAFSPDGRLVLTGGDEGTTIWNAATGRPERLLRSDPGVLAAVFSPDGRLIATGEADGDVRIVDAGTGREVKVLRGRSPGVLGSVREVAFSPRGNLLVSVGHDADPWIWAVDTWRAVRVLRGHAGWVQGASFSPDGTRVVTASGDGTARIWRAREGTPMRVLRGHKGWVYAAAFSPDGALVATAADDHGRIWDVASGKVKATLEGHRGAVLSVAFDADGKRIVTTGDDRTARIWKTESGRQLQVLPGRMGPVLGATFSGDGRVVVGGVGTASIWGTGVGREVRVFRVKGDSPYGVSFVSDGKLIGAGYAGGVARLWNRASGEQVLVLRTGESPGDVLADATTTVAFSVDGKLVAAGGDDAAARLYSTRTGKQVRSLGEDSRFAAPLEFSPDGETVLTAFAEGDDRSGPGLVPVAKRGDARTVGGPDDYVLAAAFSPDVKLLAVGDETGTVVIRSVRTGKQVRVLPSAEDGEVNDVSFSPDAKLIVTAGSDETARIWVVATGKQRHVLRGHTGAVRSAAFDPSGRFVVTAGDTTARVWSAADGAHLWVVPSQGQITGPTFSPDGRTIAMADGDAIRLFGCTPCVIPRGELLARAKRILARPGVARAAAG